MQGSHGVAQQGDVLQLLLALDWSHEAQSSCG